MRRSFIHLLPLAIPFALADVQFTSPAAGSRVEIPDIAVSWKDSGKAPSISDLTIYTLSLMVGGNEEDNMLELTAFVSQGDFSTGYSAQGTIPAGIAEPIKNGFFFKITSTAATGGTIVNYSDRFSIPGLTGSTDPQYKDAAAALGGSTNPPTRQVDIPGFVVSSSAAPSSTSSTFTTSPKPTVTVTTGPGSSPTNSNSPSSSGGGPVLDSGVWTGIAIAALVVVLLSVGLCVWGFCIRKKRKHQEAGAQKSRSNTDLSTMELQKQASTAQLSELDADGRIVEIDHGTHRSEVGRTSIRVELEGDSAPVHETLGTPVMPYARSPISPLSRTGTDTLESQEWGDVIDWARGMAGGRQVSREDLRSRAGSDTMTPTMPLEKV